MCGRLRLLGQEKLPLIGNWRGSPLFSSPSQRYVRKRVSQKNRGINSALPREDSTTQALHGCYRTAIVESGLRHSETSIIWRFPINKINIGYVVQLHGAISKTDTENFPLPSFWWQQKNFTLTEGAWILRLFKQRLILWPLLSTVICPNKRSRHFSPSGCTQPRAIRVGFVCISQPITLY